MKEEVTGKMIVAVLLLIASFFLGCMIGKERNTNRREIIDLNIELTKLKIKQLKQAEINKHTKE